MVIKVEKNVGANVGPDAVQPVSPITGADPMAIAAIIAAAATKMNLTLQEAGLECKFAMISLF